MTSMWRFAMQNLSRNRRRNLATGFAVALGFAALLALGGYTRNAQTNLQVDAVYHNRTGHLSIYKKDGLEEYTSNAKEFSLGRQEQAAIERVLAQNTNVEAFTPLFYGNGLVGNGCKTLPFIATGIVPETERWVRQHPAMQPQAERNREHYRGQGIWEFDADYRAIALSQGLARLLGKPKVVADFQGDPPLVIVDCSQPEAKEMIAADANVQLMSVSWSGMTSAIDGEVVGHFSTGNAATNTAAILIPLRDLQELYGTDMVTSYSVWLKDEGALEETFAAIAGQLDKVGLDVDVYQWDDERINPMYAGTIDFLFTLVGFVTAILVTIVIFSILNASTITVIERSREIGMLRSIGFTRGEIQGLFAREMGILTLLSVVAGGIAGGIGMAAVTAANVTFQPPGMVAGIKLEIMPDLYTVIYATLMVFVVAAVANLMAVRKLSRVKIAVLLASEQC